MDASIAACASVMCRPLPVVFDRVGSFSNHNRSDNNAFELRCDADTDAAIVRLQQSLKVALRRSGLRPKPSTTPHMTLLCDRLVVPEHPITPIRWTATQFALILSHVGIGHHQRIAQWELG